MGPLICQFVEAKLSPRMIPIRISLKAAANASSSIMQDIQHQYHYIQSSMAETHCSLLLVAEIAINLALIAISWPLCFIMGDWWGCFQIQHGF
jgi:hypothetical protein